MSELSRIDDPDLASLVGDMVKYGAHIGSSSHTDHVVHMNWPSTQKFRTGIQEYIAKHQATGAISRPLSVLPPGFRTSPLGAFIRKGTQKLRVIHDLSWPPGRSVNDTINKEDYSVVYTSVSEAVKLCQQLSTPWLAKTDLQDAYLACPVRPDENHVLGFSWESEPGNVQYYLYQSIALGLRSSARVFDDIATALNKICINRGASSRTIHYLDDLLTISSSKQDCKQSLDVITDTATRCGFTIKASKTVGPSRVIEFLGIVIDTINQTVQMSPERLVEIRTELLKWKNRPKSSKRELLSIIGKLQFCSQVIYPGHMFVKRLIECSKKVASLHYKVYLDTQAQRDLNWWLANMNIHNGKSWFQKPFNAATANIMFSDASNTAVAAVLGTNWTVIEYKGEYAWLLDKDIAYKELYAVVLGVATFGRQLYRSQLLMNIDNKAVHYCVQAGKSKDAGLMGLIRALYHYTTIHHIQYQSCHLAGVDNILADSLSRGRPDVFFTALPSAHPSMTRPCRIMTDFM